jgi:hypothetical protein
MELTKAEEKALSRLRRHQRSWRLVRWIHLVLGVANVGLGPLLARQMLKNLDSALAAQQQITSVDLYLSALTSFGVLLCFLIALLGLWLIVRAVVLWNGQPSSTVLLALVDRLEQTQDGASKWEPTGPIPSDRRMPH